MKRSDDWESQFIQSLIDTELAHVTLKPRIKERLLEESQIRQQPLIQQLRFWLNYEMELTLPQVGVALLVVCLALGLYWKQVTSVLRIDESVLAHYRQR